MGRQRATSLKVTLATTVAALPLGDYAPDRVEVVGTDNPHVITSITGFLLEKGHRITLTMAADSAFGVQVNDVAAILLEGGNATLAAGDTLTLEYQGNAVWQMVGGLVDISA